MEFLFYQIKLKLDVIKVLGTYLFQVYKCYNYFFQSKGPWLIAFFPSLITTINMLIYNVEHQGGAYVFQQDFYKRSSVFFSSDECLNNSPLPSLYLILAL